MGISFTKEQQQVIEARNKNLLVSAAAGSGKTAVLVERILSMITDKENPVDVDRLLIVTFTNAAAAEMRERILKAILDRLLEEPDNEHLQKQSVYIHKAQITTIDRFCKYLLSNHFEDIGLDPAFRVGDVGELNLIKRDALQEVMEKMHEQAEEGFIGLLESYVSGRREEVLEDYVLKLYDFAMSYPWPEKWLTDCAMQYTCESFLEFQNKVFVKEMICYVNNLCREGSFLLKRACEICEQSDGPYMYAQLLEEEKEMFYAFSKETDYEALYEKIGNLKFARLPAKKDETVSLEKREQVKALRNQAKDLLVHVREKCFFVTPAVAYEDYKACAGNIKALTELTVSFAECYKQKKQEKNLLDFSDMEHYALEILLEEKDGEYIPTKTALAYQEHFHEVMIDEYQDSNLVQELLLSSVSRKESGHCNRFMVGDVKQSIYGFRLARPELFMEKFREYQENYENHCQDNMRIDLHKNFRSRKEVIETVNYVFEKIMEESLGGITYDEDAALYPGAEFLEDVVESADLPEKFSLYKTELLLFERKELETDESGTENEFTTAIRKKHGEAILIGNRIKELVGSFPVTDKKTGHLRPAMYKDIVILVRAGRDTQEILKEELTQQGIPVHITSRTGYFSTMEVQNVLQYLKVLSNPYDDYAMAGLLKSPFFLFTDQDLAILKGFGGRSTQEKYLVECMKAITETENKEEVQKWTMLREKVKKTLLTIEENRKKAVTLSTYELLAALMAQTFYLEYVSAMPGGEQKKANVEMLLEKAIAFEKTSFHGLFQFVRYMEQLNKYNVEEGEANTLDEMADTVRIMTIHKSKGLEFPICFVSGLAKKFNMQDVQSPVLLDIDWGIGTERIEPQLRLKAPTISKNMLAVKLKMDSLGEELRILYVALTRAKEKLILTGEVDKVDTLLKKYSGLEQERVLPFTVRYNASNALAYIVAALMGHPDFERICTVFHERDLKISAFGKDLQRQLRRERLRENGRQEELRTDLAASLEEKFSYEYPHSILGSMYTKTSVSELKLEAMQEAGEELHSIFETERPPVPYLPEFLRGEQEMGGTSRGSAYHRVLELLDFAKYELSTWQTMSKAWETDDSLNGEEKQTAGKEKETETGTVRKKELVRVIIQKLEKDMEGFVTEGRLTEEYKKLVRADRLARFIMSTYGQKMSRAAKAGRLYKERPFVMGIPANRVNPDFPKEEIVLIQGIIDVYFEEEGKLVVLDYKTDRVNELGKLVQRYETQLSYYGEALEAILHMPVRERVIYSFALEKEAVW